MFVFTLLTILILLVSTIGLGLILDIFMNLDIKTSSNSVIISGDLYLSFNYNIAIEYNDFLCFYIPSIKAYLNTTDFVLEYSFNFGSTDLNIIEFNNSLFDDLSESGPNQSSESLPKISGISSVFSNGFEFLSGLGFTMSALGILVGLQAGILAFNSNDLYNNIIFIVGIALFIASVILLVIKILIDPEEFSQWMLWGMGVGCIISAIRFFKTKDYIDDTFQYKAWHRKKAGDKDFFSMLKNIKLICGGVGFGLSIAEMFGDWDDNEIYKVCSAIFSVIAGCLSLKLANHALIMLKGKNRTYKTRIAGIYGGGSLILAAILFSIAAWSNN